MVAALGCGATTSESGADGGSNPSTDGGGQTAQLDALDQKAFAHVVTAFDAFRTKASEIWNEASNSNQYALHEMPTYLVRRDAQGNNVKGYLLNHPNPPAGAQLVTHSMLSSLGAVHRYDAGLSKFSTEQHFEFDLDIAGTKTYVFPYSSVMNGTSPDEPGFLHFFVHEGFHRYQLLEGGWQDPSGWVQSDDSAYPLTQSFVARILLEDAILSAGIANLSAANARTALQQLIAVRLARAALPEATVSGVNVATNGDSGQEWNEGTPTYVERAFSIAAGLPYDINDINAIGGRVAMSLEANAFASKADAMSYFASARQYGSGGAIALLLDQVGGTNWRSKCKDGVTPFAVAQSLYSMNASERASLVSQAESAHDYSGKLMPLANTIAGLP